MYDVSNSFLLKSKSPSQRWSVRGRINDVNFTSRNIITSTLKLSNRCSDNSDITLGAVYVGEMSCIFRSNTSINRNSWHNSKIELEFGLKVGDDFVWIPAPSGEYIVSEANHTENGVSIIAYDNMSKFDKKLSINSITPSTPLQLLQFACNRCGVELGIDNLSGFPNENIILTLYPENDIETYRDLIYWICQVICAFATIDRQGRLVVKRFVSSVVDTVDYNNRYLDSSFSDYITSYTGVSVVQIEKNKTKYYGAEEDTGLTINLGSNPLLQYDDSVLDIIMGYILNEIQLIRYVPFKQRWLGSIYYDLGDVIENINGNAGESCVCCITSYNYLYSQYNMISGVGANPALSTVRNKVDKNIQGLLDKLESEKYMVYHFMNTYDIEVLNGNTDNIISIVYGTLKNTTISFYAEIQLDVECEEDIVNGIYDTVITVKYRNNGEDLAFSPIETYLDGKHILHLIQKVQVEGNTSGNFVVSINVNGGNISIPIGDCKAWLEGTGLVAEEQWDGTLTLSDIWNATLLPDDISVVNYSDVLQQSLYVPVGVSFAETISDILLPQDIAVSSYSESITNYIGIMYDSDSLIYGSDVSLVDGQLVTNYNTAIITTPVTNVFSISKLYVEDVNATYLVSFDGGITYMTYDGEDWIESSASSMTKAVLEAITDYPLQINGVVIQATITPTSSLKAIWII